GGPAGPGFPRGRPVRSARPPIRPRPHRWGAPAAGRAGTAAVPEGGRVAGRAPARPGRSAELVVRLAGVVRAGVDEPSRLVAPVGGVLVVVPHVPAAPPVHGGGGVLALTGAQGHGLTALEGEGHGGVAEAVLVADGAALQEDRSEELRVGNELSGT